MSLDPTIDLAEAQERQGILFIVEDNPSALAKWFLLRTLSYAQSLGIKPFLVKNLSRSSVTENVPTPNWLRSYLGDSQIVSARFGSPAWQQETLREVFSQLPRTYQTDKVFVSTIFEDYTQVALELAEATGCKYPSIRRYASDRSWSIRDKAHMRKRWNVPSRGTGNANYRLTSHLCLTEEEAISAARDMLARYEEGIVVKPRGMAASLGVVHVREQSKLHSIVRQASSADFVENLKENGVAPPGILIEEFVSGRELSLEIVVDSGLYEIAAITEKHTGKIGDADFAELAHIVPARGISSDEYHKIKDVAEFVVRSMDIFCCVIHLEVKIAKDGRIVPIEVGIRPAGDRIPFLVAMHGGPDLIDSHIRLSLGIYSRSVVPSNAVVASGRFSAIVFAKSFFVWQRIRLLGDYAFSAHGDCAGRWGSIVLCDRSEEQIDEILRIADIPKH